MVYSLPVLSLVLLCVMVSCSVLEEQTPTNTNVSDYDSLAVSDIIEPDTEPELEPNILRSEDHVHFVHPHLDWPYLAWTSIREGGLGCISSPWMQDCKAKVHLFNLQTGLELFWTSSATARSRPKVHDGHLIWKDKDGHLQIRRTDTGEKTKPFSNSNIYLDPYCSDGKVYVYLWGGDLLQPHPQTGIASFDLSSSKVQWELTDYVEQVGFLPESSTALPGFSVGDGKLVFNKYVRDPETNSYRMQMFVSVLGTDVSQQLTFADSNNIWPRISGSRIYYLSFDEEYYVCGDGSCNFRLKMLDLESLETTVVAGEDGQISGLVPPVPVGDGVAWIDHTQGAYRLMFGLGEAQIQTTMNDYPIALFSGLAVDQISDSSISVIWSSPDGDRSIFLQNTLDLP